MTTQVAHHESVQGATHGGIRVPVFERLCLLVGIAEIPLQLDKYFMFHEHDANLGAMGGFNISLTTISLVALYWSWFCGASIARQEVRLRFNFGIPMLLYIFVVLLSVVAAAVPMLTLFDVFLLGQAYLLFFYLANRIRCRADLLYCVACLAITMLIQAVFIFGLSAMGSAAVGKEFNIGPIVLSVWDDGRPTGSMQSAVLAGSALAIMWLPCAVVSISTGSKSVKLICFLATVFGLIAILLTQTRGAILSSVLGASMVGLGLCTRRWLPNWIVPASVVMAIICAFPAYRVVRNRIQGDDHGSATARIHLTAIAMEMIRDNPIVGFGAGNCHIAGQKYADQAKYRAEWYYTIHCKYLLVWIETGLLGLICFLCLLGTGIRQGLSAWFTRDRTLAPLGLALMTAVLGHMLHMLVDVFNSRPQVQLLWVILGLAAAVWRISIEDQNQERAETEGWHGGIEHVT